MTGKIVSRNQSFRLLPKSCIDSRTDVAVPRADMVGISMTIPFAKRLCAPIVTGSEIA